MTAPKLDVTKIGPFRVAPRVRDGKPTGAWIVDLPPHLSPSGKRSRLTIATKSEAIAEAKRLLRELHLEGAIRGHGPKVTGLSFSELAKRWLDDQADRVATGKKRPISLETDAFWLKPIIAVFGVTDGANIGTRELVAYQRARLDHGRSPSTINSEVALIRRVLQWAADHNVLERVPKVEQIPVPRKRVPIPTITEMARILEALPARTALLVRFIAEAGCRKGEAFGLEWADINHVDGVVMIRRKSHFTPKTEGSDRDIPVSMSLMTALAHAHREARKTALTSGHALNPLVFPGRGGVKLTDFDKALARAVKAAGVFRDGVPLKLTPHVLRKAHATWQKQRGLDDALLQPRLGHAPGSRITASTYVHMTTDDQRRAVIDFDKEKRAR